AAPLRHLSRRSARAAWRSIVRANEAHAWAGGRSLHLARSLPRQLRCAANLPRRSDDVALRAAARRAAPTSAELPGLAGADRAAVQAPASAAAASARARKSARQAAGSRSAGAGVPRLAITVA